MKTRANIAIVLCAVLLLATASSCKQKTAQIITITATDNGWDSQKFHNALAKLVIENAFDGYKFQLSTASSTMNWESMKNGDVDVDIESWTENVVSYPDDVKNGDIVNIGVLVPDSKQGLYVPRYVIEGDPARGIAALAPGLKEVKDLAKYPRAFPDDENPSRGRMYGAIPGWMCDEILHKKYIYYRLDRDFNYVRLGSESALFASLMAAYNLGEAWVGYCYEPTWITGKLQVVLLDDAPYEEAAFSEGRTSFSSQQLLTVSSRQFPAKAPEILAFLKKYRTGSALVSETLAYLDDTKATHDEAAVWFLKNHDKMLDEWLPAANAKKMREYLAKK